VSRARGSLRSALAFALARPVVGFVWLGVVTAGLVVAAASIVFARVRRQRGPRPWSAAVPVLAPFILSWRSGARQERETVARYSGQPLGESYHPLPPERRERAQVLFDDPASWLDAAYFGAMSMLGLLVLAPVWWLSFAIAVALGGLPGGAEQGATFGILLLGVGAAFAVPALARAEASLQVTIAQALLGPREGARLAAEVEEERARRRLALDAAEAERRRIERDLHDGAQQRLSALALDLGMAREKLASDPAAASELLDRAHGDAKQALGELRSLARGIHPALLTDRGLGPAVEALAARAALPVEVTVDLPRRPPATVESAVYFTVAEALTNVARHAQASTAAVSVACHDDLLVVEVRDDGRGGADPSGGTGLAGLADRMAGLGGTLRVDSPPGGPTVVGAEIPCGS
jgi:signal transduction histidine kinase